MYTYCARTSLWQCSFVRQTSQIDKNLLRFCLHCLDEPLFKIDVLKTHNASIIRSEVFSGNRPLDPDEFFQERGNEQQCENTGVLTRHVLKQGPVELTAGRKAKEPPLISCSRREHSLSFTYAALLASGQALQQKAPRKGSAEGTTQLLLHPAVEELASPHTSTLRNASAKHSAGLLQRPDLRSSARRSGHGSRRASLGRLLSSTAFGPCCFHLDDGRNLWYKFSHSAPTTPLQMA